MSSGRLATTGARRMATLPSSVHTYVPGFHDTQSVERMPYRSLGSTGMSTSALGLGSSALGGAFGPIDEAESVEVVRRSLRAGINWIDSAPWYGHGASERILGKALDGVPRTSFYLATKVGRFEPEVGDMFDFSGDRTARSVDESLARTGLEYIDLIQVHDPEFAPSLEVVLDQTLPALQRAKDEGKVRHIGVTGYPLDLQRELIERSEVELSCSLAYCHYGLHDTTLVDGGFLDFLEARRMGCVNASPLAMGLLTPSGPPGWHPANQVSRITESAAKARAYCEGEGVDIAKLAMHFTLRQERLTTTLVSAPNWAQMEQNIGVFQDRLTDHEELSLIHI
eukprot:TRINITY_DN37177_c0_g1_i1.p1 TRINITY_DN37177_c0_g1~~TRINITY_DN37177_c0_g1_i1.p1  ORF type:complete len:339 (+),score=71.18 TRINITY_DN37177_c0_g1_i1:202-1218(+)